eukprot:03415_3
MNAQNLTVQENNVCVGLVDFMSREINIFDTGVHDVNDWALIFIGSNVGQQSEILYQTARLAFGRVRTKHPPLRRLRSWSTDFT